MTRARDLASNAQGSKPTIVDAKGDIIVATAADTVDRLAVGSNGDTVVADSAATTGLRWSGTPSASNPVINSAMEVWQRGTSISLAASTTFPNGFTADRWQTNTGANQATTISRQATGDTTNLPNIQYALRYQRNSGQTGTGGYVIVQNFESNDSIPFAGKTVTLSFYARKGANYSATSDILNPRLFSGTGTDQNAFNGFTNQATVISQNSTLTTTWQRFSYSGSIASTATQLAVAFFFTPTGTAGAADYFEITGVQLDVGSVALPFRRSGGTIQGELAACQRYFNRFVDNSSTSTGHVAMGRTDGNNAESQYVIRFNVEMRGTPTFTVSAAGDFKVGAQGNSAATAITANNLNTKSLVLVVTSGALQTYQATALYGNATTNGRMDASAEL